jgi:hypothetical protein
MQSRLLPFAAAVIAALGLLSASRAEAAAAQYLYVYNTGSPGIYTGEYARYQLPGLSLLETTAADGVASPEAFGPNGQAYFVDESPQGHFGVFAQPLGSGVVAGVEQFSGVPCMSTSLATGPTGNEYVVQYCSGNVLEFKPGATKKGAPKKPIAAYSGGNLGSGKALPTYAAVDHKGNLFVGDNLGGVTFFAAGSKKAVVAYPFGHSQAITQIVVDAHDDVWSVHYADPTLYEFANATSCQPVSSGPVMRAEVGEHFVGGHFVDRLYSAPTDSADYASQGLSVAVDAAQRVYVGAFDTDSPSVVTEYAPGQRCPDLPLSLVMADAADPQVAVDGMKRWYVTDQIDNTISSYKGGTRQRIAQITQATGIIDISSIAISP